MMGVICDNCYNSTTDLNLLGSLCSCKKGMFIKLSDMVVSLSNDRNSLVEQLNKFKEQMEVLFDALLSRLPESALESLKPEQISVLESLVNKRVDTIYNARSPYSKLQKPIDIKDKEPTGAYEWIYTGGEPKVSPIMHWEIGSRLPSIDDLVGDAALAADELRYENGSGFVDFAALGLVDPNQTTEK